MTRINGNPQPDDSSGRSSRWRVRLGPLAESRSDSRSIVYRVDPETMDATEVFRYPDHVGAIVHAFDDRSLHGVSGGSRRYYRWRRTGWGTVTNADWPPERLATDNPSHYVDYQDAQYLGEDHVLAAGLATYSPPDGTEFALGGIDLVDLDEHRPSHQVPGRRGRPRDGSCLTTPSSPRPGQTDCGFTSSRKTTHLGCSSTTSICAESLRRQDRLARCGRVSDEFV